MVVTVEAVWRAHDPCGHGSNSHATEHLHKKSLNRFYHKNSFLSPRFVRGTGLLEETRFNVGFLITILIFYLLYVLLIPMD